MNALLIFITFVSSYVIKEEPQPTCSVDNFHKVSEELYRSAQPSKKEMKEIELFGIKSVLNLRLRRDDKQEIEGTSLKSLRVAIKTKKMTYLDMVNAMKEFDAADKPVLVHCRRGSDRTGCFVACYRMLYLDWSKEDALKAFTADGLGYYEKLFPNLREFVEELDIEKFRQDVFGSNDK